MLDRGTFVRNGSKEVIAKRGTSRHPGGPKGRSEVQALDALAGTGSIVRLDSGFAARLGMTAAAAKAIPHSSVFFALRIQGRVSSPLALAVISLSLRPCMVEKA
jgi:hypothetical protein